MFKRNIIWRGIIYALLMIFGKFITGIWLVRFSLQLYPLGLANGLKRTFSGIHLFCKRRISKKEKQKQQTPMNQSQEQQTPIQMNQFTEAHKEPLSNQANIQNQKDNNNTSKTLGLNPESESQEESQATIPRPRQNSTISYPPKPKSLYPPTLLGLAMVARGEIGYLIASLAQSRGMFTSTNTSTSNSSEISEIYLVIIWAISICTLIGPICVGTLVKRVKKLQLARRNSGPDPLGVWGI